MDGGPSFAEGDRYGKPQADSMFELPRADLDRSTDG